jgi:hypothetical protein
MLIEPGPEFSAYELWQLFTQVVSPGEFVFPARPSSLNRDPDNMIKSASGIIVITSLRIITKLPGIESFQTILSFQKRG